MNFGGGQVKKGDRVKINFIDLDFYPDDLVRQLKRIEPADLIGQTGIVTDMFVKPNNISIAEVEIQYTLRVGFLSTELEVVE